MTHTNTLGKGSISHGFALFLLVHGGDSPSHTRMPPYPRCDKPRRGRNTAPFPTDGGASQVILCLSSGRGQLRRQHLASQAGVSSGKAFEVLLTNAFRRLSISRFTAYLFCSLPGEVKSTLYANCFSVPVGGWEYVWRLEFRGRGGGGHRFLLPYGKHQDV